MDHGMIARPEMQALMAQSGIAITVPPTSGPDETLVLEPFAARLAAFQQHANGTAAPAVAPNVARQSSACL